MKRLAIAVFAGICCLASPAQAEIGIISPESAQQLINHPDPAQRPIVLDTRGGYKDYFRSHLPTAHHINFDTLRGTDHGVPVQYLPEDLTKALLQRAGVQKDKTHLIYATGAELPNDEILSASMVAYILEKFGVTDIRIVDGGLAYWQQQGLPVTQDYFGNPPGNLPGKTKADIAISLDQLLEMKDRPNVLLVDARPPNEYLGEDDVWVRKGHIPGAINFFWAQLMEAENTHKFAALEPNLAKLAKAGVTKDKEIIVYCGTSREGSLLRFYLAHVAKFPNVRR